MEQDQSNNTAIVTAAVSAVSEDVQAIPLSLVKISPGRLAKHVIDVIAEIASRNYEPNDSEAWGGVEEITEWAAKSFGLSEDAAADLVRYSVEELRISKRPDRTSQRVAAIARLVRIKRMVLESATTKRTKTTYAFDDELDKKTGQPTGRQVQRRVKQIVEQPDMNVIAGRLLEIERFEAELRGLTGSEAEAGASTSELLQELEEIAEEAPDGTRRTTRRTRRSAAQKIKSGDAKGVAQAAMARVAREAVESAKAAGAKESTGA